MTTRASLMTRDDTFLGICEGLGEDLGIGGNWLRLGLALMLFWNPLASVGLYAAMGVVVLVSRLLFPDPRRSAAEEPVQVQAEAAPAAPAPHGEPELPLAA